MKLKVISIGKDRSGLFAPGVEEYAGRLQHYTKTTLVELPESKNLSAEGEATLGKLGERDVLVALDERGRALSSVELSQWLAKQLQGGRDLAFAIGGDEGLAPAVREKAALVLSLSRMTLPHRLARLVLLEQVYRAFTLVRGEPYHK
ncbi:MAG: 23S rRNA (pseudouridine(1915)-N(3))-methyltransferase RlmH [Myxococcaceae bacterium]|nr:23S rRNA (pseudouridine(1915)-N(3))-methyltransferase RlmH [Myxococcaceae bacterium]